MSLTRSDMGPGGPMFHVIGQRADGSNLVLESTRSRRKAHRRAALYRAHLDGLRSVIVERECLVSEQDRQQQITQPTTPDGRKRP